MWNAALAGAVTMAGPTARLLGTETGDGETKRPNVLFLLSDDHRADAIAALGNPVIKTPNMDRLVRNGVAFKNAYCMGSKSNAVSLSAIGLELKVVVDQFREQVQNVE